MINEELILKVLREQQEELASYSPNEWVDRKEESLFELDSPLAQVVIGVRRSGKSTLCHKVLMQHNIKYAYANFDDDRFRDMGTKDLNTLLSCLYQLYGTDISYIMLDEVQDVDGWYLFVNRLLRTKIHMIITGSNAKLLSGELATHLTGRYLEIRLYPFSFVEYCAYKKIKIHPETTKEEAAFKTAMLDYIQDGGFPEMQFVRNKSGYITNLVETILTKDIQRRFNIRNINMLRGLAYYILNHPCQEINYLSIANLFDTSNKTVQKYISYLQQAFLTQLLSKHSFKFKERVCNSKVYIVDPGLQLTNGLFVGPNLGWRLENIVYIELQRRCIYPNIDIYYYKPTPRSKEVDFVVCQMLTTQMLVQVTLDLRNSSTYKRETSALIEASDKLECNNMYIICLNEETKDISIDGKVIHIVSVFDWLVNVPEYSFESKRLSYNGLFTE